MLLNDINYPNKLAKKFMDYSKHKLYTVTESANDLLLGQNIYKLLLQVYDYSVCYTNDSLYRSTPYL